VLISEHGLLAIQQQLHFCKRYPWTTLGDDLNIIELPLEQGNINLAMLTADDANIPELVKAAALNNIHLLLVPFDIQEPCEVEHSLLARAAENRICIVAASREKNFDIDKHDISKSDTGKKNIYAKNKVKRHKSTGLIANLTRNVIPSTSREFDGNINQLIVKYQHGKITKAVVHPSAACHKL
jgi:predicted amidohydrolase